MIPETGFLYSQIGYDLIDSKRTLVRAATRDFLSDKAELAVIEVSEDAAEQVFPLKLWGEKWGSWWWIADFSPIDKAGSYILQFGDRAKVLHRSEPVRVDDNVLWNQSMGPVAFEQLAERRKQARNGLGFKDCGHHWREVASHTPLIIGLCDLLEVGFAHLDAEQVLELKGNIIHGCNYLARAQDAAQELGLGDGALVHEFPSVLHIIPGNIAQSAVAFARAGRLLLETHRDQAMEFLDRGAQAFRYLREDATPWTQGFHAPSHGAPEGFEPPGNWMTRDLLMMLFAAVELWQSGGKAYQRIAAEIARAVIARQVPQEQAEGGYWGHFYTFDGVRFTEKANVHHHWGHDTGAVFPHYLLPLALMVRLWGYHPEVAVWRAALERFRDGYLIPACKSNPFGILPMGYWENEGLLTFCGPWHGWNVTYGFAAALASQLHFVIGGDELRDIAVNNLQWIAGLNAGVTSDSFSSCLKYKEDIPPGVAKAVSMIHGVGNQFAGCWTGIKGTIMNGFSNNPQFEHSITPSAANDGPRHFTDEDWIPHSGGWIAGLAWLREVAFFKT